MAVIDVTKMGARARTLGYLEASSPLLVLSATAANVLAPAEGSEVYLTLRDGTTMERVLVTNRTGSTFVIQRGMDGTTASAFRAGACISIEWNPEQLRAYLEMLSPGSTSGYTGVVTTPSILSFNSGICTNVASGGGC